MLISALCCLQGMHLLSHLRSPKYLYCKQNACRKDIERTTLDIAVRFCCRAEHVQQAAHRELKPGLTSAFALGKLCECLVHPCALSFHDQQTLKLLHSALERPRVNEDCFKMLGSEKHCILSMASG